MIQLFPGAKVSYNGTEREVRYHVQGDKNTASYVTLEDDTCVFTHAVTLIKQGPHPYQNTMREGDNKEMLIIGGTALHSFLDNPKLITLKDLKHDMWGFVLTCPTKGSIVVGDFLLKYTNDKSAKTVHKIITLTYTVEEKYTGTTLNLTHKHQFTTVICRLIALAEELSEVRSN